MQTLTEIRRILQGAGLAPRRALGQNFLIDLNLMGKLLELADLEGVSCERTVLEVGPGTGSLTEELLARCGRVVAVELDRGMADVLEERLGRRPNFKLIRGDILAGKRRIAPAVLAELAGGAGHAHGPGENIRARRPVVVQLVANLPYDIATPLIAQCLLDSWQAQAPGAAQRQSPCRFERLTFTVQREVADRLTAKPGGAAYGPVSILVGLLGRLTPGAIVPPTAFWPQPNVAGRILRIDFDARAAAELARAETLAQVLTLAFAQRRKQIGSILRRRQSPFAPRALEAALAAAGIDHTARPQEVAPQQFRALANALPRA